MNILIRPLTIDDAVVSYKWRNDPEIWKFTSSKPTTEITEKIERNWLENTLTDSTKSRFAILCDGVYVGNVQLTDIVPFQTAEFHVFIGDKSFWGKGIAKEATYQILTYAKEVLNLNSVFLDVKNENLPAIKSYKKSGFEIINETNDFIRMVCDIKTLEPPMVSVFCMVYNHEKYITQTLDGFLMQKTSFSTVIVLGEDCSIDGSRKVIVEYAKKYPGKFKLLLNDENIDAHKNQELVLENCTGKYIALCEGDDYWTDPLKLQKQVDYLEKHPEAAICFHRATVLKEDGTSYLHPIPKSNHKGNYEYKDLLEHHNFITTASVVFRKPKDFNIPSWFKGVPFGDMALYQLVSKNKKIMCLDEVMSVYRLHNQGLYSKLSQRNKIKNFLIFYKVIYPYLLKENKAIVKIKIKQKQLKLAKLKYPNSRLMRWCYSWYIKILK